MQNDDERGPLNPTALAVGDAAKLLAKVSGAPINEQMLRGDIDTGAPTNANGTVNLVHYAAWLVQEMASGE